MRIKKRKTKKNRETVKKRGGRRNGRVTVTEVNRCFTLSLINVVLVHPIIFSALNREEKERIRKGDVLTGEAQRGSKCATQSVRSN